MNSVMFYLSSISMTIVFITPPGFDGIWRQVGEQLDFTFKKHTNTLQKPNLKKKNNNNKNRSMLYVSRDDSLCLSRSVEHLTALKTLNKKGRREQKPVVKMTTKWWFALI